MGEAAPRARGPAAVVERQCGLSISIVENLDIQNDHHDRNALN
jgi:hypothetical protein